jgi:hypothetical protein
MPLAPRVALAVDLAVGERVEGPLFLGANRDRVGPHTLRHAFITAALDADVPLRDVVSRIAVCGLWPVAADPDETVAMASWLAHQGDDAPVFTIERARLVELLDSVDDMGWGDFDAVLSPARQRDGRTADRSRTAAPKGDTNVVVVRPKRQRTDQLVRDVHRVP